MIDQGLGKRGVRDVPTSALRLERVPVPEVEAAHVLVVDNAKAVAHREATGERTRLPAVIDEPMGHFQDVLGQARLQRRGG